MLKKSALQICFILAALVSNAQIPDIIPSGEAEPIDITPFNIILYFVLPVLLFIFYLWYRKSKRRNKK
jgi:hypothetical protein